MFQRRLLLLVTLAVGVAGVLSVRAATLTVGDAHRRAEAEAERALERVELVPTVRGRIVDRTGRRVLAFDEPGWEAAASYDLINGDWAVARAQKAARREAGDRWASMHERSRRVLIDRQLPAARREEAQVWAVLAEVSHESPRELAQRRERVKRRVQAISADVTQRNLQRLMQDLGTPIPWREAQVAVAEERKPHAMVDDLDDDARRLLQTFVTEANSGAEDAEALAAWREVEVRRTDRRRLPLETLGVAADRSMLPAPLRDEQPLEVTLEGVALHTLGLMRAVWAADVEGRPFSITDDRGGYRAGDTAGNFGIERALEDRLRGQLGRLVTRRDTGEQHAEEPVPGRDVRLTIDLALQAQVQAIMTPDLGLMRVQPWNAQPTGEEQAEGEGAPPPAAPPMVNKVPRLGEELAGAAVVLDIRTGEVLAAVTVPTMPLRDVREHPEAIFDDVARMPFLNRAVSRPYQPGSTLKPLVFVAAASAGVIQPGETIDCTGHLLPHRTDIYKCWIFGSYGQTHGPLAARDAIARSCNIYFFHAAQRLGEEGLVGWLREFGLGTPTGCGLPEDAAGDLPDPAAIDHQPRWQTVNDARNMGIGQGPVRWTPMQAAAAYAALVRGGDYLEPTLIAPRDRLTPQRSYRIALAPWAVEEAMGGMRDVVNERYGTGRWLPLEEPFKPEPIFNVSGATILGKSGTAQTSPTRRPIDDDGDGLPDRWGETLREGNHGWFIALVQPDGEDRPTHVVAVVVEHGGSGSKTAGPIANAIIHAMQRTGVLRTPREAEPVSQVRADPE